MLPAVVLGLVLGGCGGDSSDDVARPGTRQTSNPVPAERPAPAQERARPPRRRLPEPQVPEPQVPLPSGEEEAPSVTTLAWTGTARLELVDGVGFVRKYKGPLAGELPGEVRARLRMEGPSASGSFVAALPGGTVEGTLSVVTSLGDRALRYTGTATTTRGTDRYEHLTPTSLTVTGTSSPSGIRMRFSGNLRY